eukprot:TRINITY_DN1760_c0_g1_i1.p1 TRINITY_DN1760_c0_g1~~TRINITY_DN1760_c0_g1_i1.p1  ORF type:complete len:246 (-),score=61.12 TRINITY_DN1760_c0_g1_i1:38-745(-)
MDRVSISGLRAQRLRAKAAALLNARLGEGSKEIASNSELVSCVVKCHTHREREEAEAYEKAVRFEHKTSLYYVAPEPPEWYSPELLSVRPMFKESRLTMDRMALEGTHVLTSKRDLEDATKMPQPKLPSHLRTRRPTWKRLQFEKHCDGCDGKSGPFHGSLTDRSFGGKGRETARPGSSRSSRRKASDVGMESMKSDGFMGVALQGSALKRIECVGKRKKWHHQTQRKKERQMDG